jgi:uncharacterized paraquat-inducible protein A
MSLPEPIEIPPLQPTDKVTICPCPECKNRVNLPTDLLGKLIKCPFCKKTTVIKRSDKFESIRHFFLLVGVLIFFGLVAIWGVWFIIRVLRLIGIDVKINL